MSPALILGGASCVWSDLRALAALGGYATATGHTLIDNRPVETVALVEWPGLVVAVNDVAAYYPGHVDHWVSLHPNKFPKWKAMRKTWHGGEPVRWCHEAEHTTTIAQRKTPLLLGGSSGLFAAYEVATLALGCSPIVLCGIPMTATPHFHRQGKWNAVSTFTNAWNALASEGKLTHVRSMSPDSFTQRLLGAPTSEWLQERKAA